MEYINQERIKLARQLLTEQQKSITPMSGLCGFSNVNYFARIFKKTEGIMQGACQYCMKGSHISSEKGT